MHSTDTVERGRTSDLLGSLAARHPGPRVSLADVVHALGDRGFGVLILLLALPNIVPGPALPGFSAAFAVPLALLAAQLAGGRVEPRLPDWMMRRSMTLAGFRQLVSYAAPPIRRVERWLRPRPGFIGRRPLGFALLVIILALAMPIPFANIPPGIALALVALGLIEKDGTAVAAGLLLGIPACAWVVLLLVGSYRLVTGTLS